jgi:uncharacterized protein YyaL (SSP411 family)
VLRGLLILALLVPSLAADAQKQLATEKSRYYSNHADSTIQWQVWNDAALAKAKKEGKLVFVAMGIVARDEIRVMHAEVFHSGVAEVLNQSYVPLLLDRNERPDVAAALDAMLGVSNLILTPDLHPVAGFEEPKHDSAKALLAATAERWKNDRPAVLAEAALNYEKARAAAERITPQAVKAETLDRVTEAIGESYDAKRGGFGGAPKYPRPMTLSYLFAFARAMNHEPVRGIAVSTLKTMSTTPVHDQLGGGFHRGTVDADWRMPMFEKMLYDQALLAIAYTEGWQLTRDEEMASMAKSILFYVTRDLMQNGTAFDASQDAYSYIPNKGAEFARGAFYLWEREEIGRIFKPQADLVFRLYGMTAGGNVSDTIPHFKGKNLLWLREKELLKEHNAALVPILMKLLQSRQGRPAPFRDVNVLSGWNGLAISAFARVGATFDDPKSIATAKSVAQSILGRLWNPKTKTLYRANKVEATAQDYALLIQGLLDLFEATYELKWYEQAMTLQQRQDELFWNDAAGRYGERADLPAALRGLATQVDVDVPAANSVAAMNLLRLANLTGAAGWRQRADVIFHSFGTRLATDGARLPSLATAYAASLTRAKQVVVIPGKSSEEADALLRAAHQTYIPLRTIVLLPQKGAVRERMLALLPFTKELAADPEKATVYVCSMGTCERPTPTADELVKLLK